MSASVKAVVNPSVLKWARETTGYGVEDVVEKLKRKTVTNATVEMWESGDSWPTYAQLKKLAEIYKRPVVLFFFSKPPSEETPEVQMRSLPETDAGKLPPRIRFLIRDAVIRRLNLAELYGDNTPEEYQKFKLEIEKIKSEVEERDSYSTARHIRNYLQISLEDQLDWKDAGQAFKQWRKAVEEVGIWVFKEPFGKDFNEYSGFSLWDEKFPIIYVNNSMTQERQIFTLFHELGHLLKRTGGVDFRRDVSEEFKGRYRRDEVFCNAFAGELLVPKEALPQPGSDIPRDNEIWEWAEEYKVSHQVILRRFLDNGLVSKNYYHGKVSILEQESQIGESYSSGGPVPLNTRRANYLGDKYLTRTFQKYYEDRIDEHQLADYLGIKLKDIGELENVLLKRLRKNG